jgi:hypothetical protein
MKRFFLLTMLAQLIFAAILIFVRNGLPSTWVSPFTDQMSDETQLIDRGWCWRGVCPGKTSLTTAIMQLQTSDDDVLTQSKIGLATLLRWETRADPTWQGTINAAGALIETIHLNIAADKLRLGDVMAHYGRPSFTFSQLEVSLQNNVRHLSLTTFICFEGGLCFTIKPTSCNKQMRFDAYVPIRQVFLYPVAWARGQFGVVSEWQSLNRQYMRCPVVIY